MKKITTKVLTIVAACAAMVFASCAQPSTSGSGAGGSDRPAAEEITIMDTAKEITWSDFCIVASEKFTGTEPKTISIYYDCVAVAGGDEGYTSMKIAGNYSDVALGDGTVTGATLKSGDKGALEGTGNVGETGKVITYVPTAAEWATLSTGAENGGNPDGLYINGNNIKITKITLK